MGKKRQLDSLDGGITGDDVGRVNERGDVSLGEQSTFGNEDSSVGDLDGVGGGLDDLGQVTDLTERYEIQDELGRGGMGVVQKAFDRRLKRTVAIKRLKGDISTNRRALQRFLVEAQAVASLNHFHIVQIYDFGRDPEGPFLILEYVPGRSLSDRLKDGPIPVEQAVELTGQLCEALAMAHRHGIIHRDIKPANVLLTTDDEVKLTDFGLAKQEDRSTSMHTQTGVVLGTVDFMPPEQRRGATEVDARSDLWSVGATLYQMLTGRSPRVIRLDAVPESLRDIVGQSLEEDPAKRFQTAVEFHRVLRDAAENGSGKVRPTSDLAEGQCSGCGVSNELNAKFCRGCGISLEGTCLSCNQSLPVWTRHCTHCGGNQTELLLQQRKILEAVREQAESLQRDYQYEQAITLAQTTAAKIDPRLADSVAWVEEFVSDVQRESKQQTTRRDEVVAEAQQFHNEHRYADAVRVLASIPAGFHNKTIRELSQQAQACEIELKNLREEIQQSLRAKEYIGLIVKVRRSLELKPDSPSTLSLLAKLESREAKAEARSDQVLIRARQRWDKHDDEGALKLLNQVPEHLENPARQSLRQKSQARLAEVVQLKQRFESSNSRTFTLAEVSRYLELRPGDSNVITLKEQLEKAGHRRRTVKIAIFLSGVMCIIVVFGIVWRSSVQKDRRDVANALVRAAMLVPMEELSVQENLPAAIAVTVTSPLDLDEQVSYSLISPVPDGVSIDSETGGIKWTPSEKQGSGVYPLTIEANVIGRPECTNRTTFNVSVNETLQLPLIASVESININEEALFQFVVEVDSQDIPPAPITFGLTGNIPDGCEIEAMTGKITWTPTEQQGPGNYEFRVTAAIPDRLAMATEMAVSVSVMDVNQPPTFSNITEQFIGPGQAYSVGVSAADVDEPAQTLTYSLLNSPKGATINADTGEVQWQIPSDWNRNAEFAVTVSDGLDSSTCNFLATMFDPTITNSVGMQLKLIPAGEFLMGSPENEEGRRNNEGPQHTVRITKPFFIGATEVTVGQWTAVMGKDRRTSGLENVAVTTNYNTQQFFAFLAKLNSREGRNYRLPTEAEWEYACRANTESPHGYNNYYVGALKDYAWYSENSVVIGEGYPHEVGLKKPNAFGLYDMHGNVSELCGDLYYREAYVGRNGLICDPCADKIELKKRITEYRTAQGEDTSGSILVLDRIMQDVKRAEPVIRGGSWRSPAGFCRAAYRVGSTFYQRGTGNEIGFRVVLVPAEQEKYRLNDESQKTTMPPVTKSDAEPPAFLNSDATSDQHQRWNLVFAAWLCNASDEKLVAVQAKFDEIPEVRRAELKWLKGWIHSVRGESESAIACLSESVTGTNADFMDFMFLAMAFQSADLRAKATIEHRLAIKAFQGTTRTYTNRGVLSPDEKLCVSELEQKLNLLDDSLIPKSPDEIFLLTEELMLVDHYATVIEVLSPFHSRWDNSVQQKANVRLLMSLYNVHRARMNAIPEAVDAIFTSELKPHEPLWAASIFNILIHANSTEQALVRSHLDRWAMDKTPGSLPAVEMAKQWIQTCAPRSESPAKAIDWSELGHLESPVSRYFAARQLAQEGNYAAADAEIDNALRLLNQGWISSTSAPGSRFLEKQLRGRLELLRSHQVVGFSDANGVSTLFLGGLLSDSVHVENTNASEILAGWLNAESSMAILSDKQLFTVNPDNPQNRELLHEFETQVSDLSVSGDGSMGWLVGGQVHRLQNGKSEPMGRGFDPNYSDNGSTFVRSTWDKNGAIQFELLRGSEHSAFTIPTHPTFSMYPSLASDETKLVYRAIGRDRTPQIGLMLTANGAVRMLTDNGESNMKPTFSPDDRFITFLQSDVTNDPSQGSIRLVVRDLQTDFEAIIATDVRYWPVRWKPLIVK